MAVDLSCTQCLTLWESHGAAVSDLRDAPEGPGREAIQNRLQAAALAIGEHQRQAHPESATGPT